MDAKILKALGDEKRFHLLELMSQRKYCVRALARVSDMSESSVSQHLKVLREAGLVYGVKMGYYTHYTVDRDALGKVIEELDAIRNFKRAPCNGPFYGCPQSEYIRCRAYVPIQERGKDTDDA